MSEKIYLYIARRWDQGDVAGYAMAADGHVLAGHMSSSETWLQHDLGLTSKRKHDKYEAHYPGGYEIEWLGWMEPGEAPAGYLAALELNKALAVAASEDA